MTMDSFQRQNQQHAWWFFAVLLLVLFGRVVCDFDYWSVTRGSLRYLFIRPFFVKNESGAYQSSVRFSRPPTYIQ